MYSISPSHDPSPHRTRTGGTPAQASTQSSLRSLRGPAIRGQSSIAAQAVRVCGQGCAAACGGVRGGAGHGVRLLEGAQRKGGYDDERRARQRQRCGVLRSVEARQVSVAG